MSVLWEGPVLLDGDGDDGVALRMRMIGVLNGVISDINSRTAP